MCLNKILKFVDFPEEITAYKLMILDNNNKLGSICKRTDEKYDIGREYTSSAYETGIQRLHEGFYAFRTITGAKIWRNNDSESQVIVKVKLRQIICSGWQAIHICGKIPKRKKLNDKYKLNVIVAHKQTIVEICNDLQ